MQHAFWVLNLGVAAVEKESEGVDEEAWAAEFGEGENEPPKPPAAEQDASGLSPLDYIKILHRTLDHPTFRALPDHQQRLYLQLIRHCQGEGKSRIRVTLAEMARWVDRAPNNVAATRKHLIDHKLLRVTVKPDRFQKAQYEVVILRPELESRLTPTEMAHRLDQFTASDLLVLEQQIRTMDPDDREDLRQQIRQHFVAFRASGYELPQADEEKVFRYMAYLKLTGRARIKQQFPQWTSY